MFLSWHDTIGSTEAAISVALVEDDADTLRLLHFLAGREQDIKCVGAFTAAQDVLNFLNSVEDERRPDVVVIDWSMPGLAAPVAIEHIVNTWPTISVIVFTAHNEPRVHNSARNAGARKIVEKDGDFDLLFREVRKCATSSG